MPRIHDTSPLYQLRRILRPHLAPESSAPLVTVATMATACGVAPATWRSGEAEARSLSGATLSRILRACHAIGYPLRPDHLYGFEPLPDAPPPESRRDGSATLARMFAASRSSDGLPLSASGGLGRWDRRSLATPTVLPDATVESSMPRPAEPLPQLGQPLPFEGASAGIRDPWGDGADEPPAANGMPQDFEGPDESV